MIAVTILCESRSQGPTEVVDRREGALRILDMVDAFCVRSFAQRRGFTLAAVAVALCAAGGALLVPYENEAWLFPALLGSTALVIVESAFMSGFLRERRFFVCIDAHSAPFVLIAFGAATFSALRSILTPLGL